MVTISAIYLLILLSSAFFLLHCKSLQMEIDNTFRNSTFYKEGMKAVDKAMKADLLRRNRSHNAEKHTTMFYLAVSISIILLLPNLYLIVNFYHREIKKATEELKRIKLLGRKSIVAIMVCCIWISSSFSTVR